MEWELFICIFHESSKLCFPLFFILNWTNLHNLFYRFILKEWWKLQQYVLFFPLNVLRCLCETDIWSGMILTNKVITVGITRAIRWWITITITIFISRCVEILCITHLRSSFICSWHLCQSVFSSWWVLVLFKNFIKSLTFFFIWHFCHCFFGLESP